jgi:putative FmdB family regulatory protein
MPLYAYRCKECGHEFEEHQRMSEDPLTECPVCQGSIRRVINSVGVVFKGSGFYVTDNKSKNPAAPSKKADDSSGSNGSKESGQAADSSSSSSSKGSKTTAVKEASST